MYKALKRIQFGIDTLNEWAGKGVSWLTTLLVVLVCFDVITRYLFSDTKAWIMELEWHLFSLVFLIGAGYAFKHDRHVRVDLFYTRFTPRDRALVNLIGGLLFLVPWCILVIIVSYDYAKVSFLLGETSPDPGGLPGRYVIKFAITAGVFLLLLQGLSSIIQSLFIYLGKEEEPKV